MADTNDELIHASDAKYLVQEIKLDRVKHLAELVQRCERNRYADIESVVLYMNGFSIRFKDIPGDIVMNDGTPAGVWQSMEMPWDHDGGVSYQDTDLLLSKIERYKTIPKEKRYCLTHHVGMRGYYHEYFADPLAAIFRARYLEEQEACWINENNGEITRRDAYQYWTYGSLVVFDQWSYERLFEKGDTKKPKGELSE